MILTLSFPPGYVFAATAASIGLSEAAAKRMKTYRVPTAKTDFVWLQVKAAGDRLLHTEPQGYC